MSSCLNRSCQSQPALLAEADGCTSLEVEGRLLYKSLNLHYGPDC